LFLERKTKCRRHDADDLIWRVVQGDRLLQNISVGTETALPKFVTENNDPRAGFIVVSSKGAAEYRVHTQHAKEIGSNECAVEMRGFAAAIRRRHLQVVVERSRAEDLVLVTQVSEIRIRK